MLYSYGIFSQKPQSAISRHDLLQATFMKLAGFRKAVVGSIYILVRGDTPLTGRISRSLKKTPTQLQGAVSGAL